MGALTVVIARRFDQTICIVSDTMISNQATGTENGIPGRLKIITIDRQFTVAYAGHANQALDAIRATRPILLESGLDAAIEHLRRATTEGPADFEFIAVAHRPDAKLHRIWDGRVSASLDKSVIGDGRILDEVERRFEQGRASSAKNYVSAFITAFTDKKIHLGTGVGGFPTSLLAQPDGHIYRGHMLSHVWKPSGSVWGATTYEDENDLLTGEWSFRHDVLTVGQAGVALLAVEVPQAKTGYVYAPLLEDDPQPVTLLSADKIYTQHQREIHDAMKQALDGKLKQLLEAGLAPSPKNE